MLLHIFLYLLRVLKGTRLTGCSGKSSLVNALLDEKDLALTVRPIRPIGLEAKGDL